jgi:hypothetical protein
MLLCETDKTANLLEWHTRHAIVLGIAKGLRFLHEECHAGPIIQWDLRPSNVLLTHDFVPMVRWTVGLTMYHSTTRSTSLHSDFLCSIVFRSLEILVLRNGKPTMVPLRQGF